MMPTVSITERLQAFSDMSKSISDSDIMELAREYLDTTTTTADMIKNRENFCRLFRLGYAASPSSIENFKKRIARMSKPKKAYTVLRQMDVGEEIVFPFSEWGKVRNAATVIKGLYGSVFKVRKIGPKCEEGDIRVVRLH